MSDAPLAALAMSQTKDGLLRHLNLSTDVYAQMAKQVDRVYKDLTSNKSNLKRNCKRKPPYDWSDIVEKAKDRAMEEIARGGDSVTSYYWSLAVPTEDCPNWIARWFLYHKFRYRDGRNRNPTKGSSTHDASSTAGDPYPGQAAGSDEYNGYQYPSSHSSTYSYSAPGYGYATTAGSSSDQYQYHYQSYNTAAYGETGNHETSSGTYYDPVRDVNIL